MLRHRTASSISANRRLTTAYEGEVILLVVFEASSSAVDSVFITSTDFLLVVAV
jgi:hypothetical protein